ncbi:MAG TPA: hypothetical protein VFG52_02315, partial [Xanthomonadales bacterium]|nr:hypothetical protein [Xanthomonadales bacterium]
QAESRWKVPGLAVLVLIPVLALWQYTWVGSPRAMQVQAAPEVTGSGASLDELAQSLRAKLTESPADLEGWVLLGKTYKTMQDYPAAVQALETADRLVPGEPVVQVELVEARLFASGNPQITEEMTQALQEAVTTQPDLQKGWWLLGLAAAQRGDDPQAITYWRELLQSMEPGSAAAQSIQAQIDEAESRILASGAEVESSAGPGAGTTWQSAAIRIGLSPAAEQALSTLPPAASLFLIARPAGENAGPPLAVRRIPQPVFPLELQISDADSMLPQRPVSGVDELQLQVRVSVTGEPMATAGDWQSAVIMLAADQLEPVELLIDQQVE